MENVSLLTYNNNFKGEENHADFRTQENCK